MNPFEFIFCWLPAGLVGLTLWMLAEQAMAHRRKGQAEQDKQDAAQRALALREQDAQRRAELHEARLAKEHNAVVLQDAKLELELLKIREEKRRQGLTAQPFEAKDYPQA